MSYDPSKRLFLGNLPDDVTKQDIIQLIRNRSRANPQLIEIGVNKRNAKKFAHVTVEGMRSVIEGVNGVPLRGMAVIATQAKPHFSCAIVAAKREKEREAEAAAAALEHEREELKQRIAEGKQKIKGKPMPFFKTKVKYATIASQVAKKFRDQFYEKRKVMTAWARGAEEKEGEGKNKEQPDDSGPSFKKHRPETDKGRGGRGGMGRGRGREHERERREKKGKGEKEVAPPPAPAPPPEPPKEQRKLAALQAKLLALKGKMAATSSSS